MPTGSVLIMVGAFVVASASSVLAADDVRQAQAAVASPDWFAPKPPTNPYQKLFKPQSQESTARRVVEQEPARAAESAPLTKPTVVCGTLLVPADASVDPRMRVFRSKDDTTTYTIRAVKPTMCHPE
jgi:hypothetical protein